MFVLKYLKGELLHRPGKTVTVALGLAMASAIIITIVSISQSLSTAQKTVLNPLSSVGTDIMVSRTVDQANIQNLDDATREEAMSDNRITMDFATLGNPGEKFSADTMMPGSMLTFEAVDQSKIDTSLVQNYAGGLILNVVHQEGTIPDLAVNVETGGQAIGFSQRFEMTDEMRAEFEAAQQKAIADIRAKGIDPNSPAGREAVRAATPRPSSTVSGTVEVPKEVINQKVGSFSTDVSSNNYTLGGVDTSKTDIGLILPSQIVEGRYLQNANEVVATRAFAQKKNYALNGTVSINNKDFTLVGIVDPKLYTMSADMYVSLADAQTLSDRAGRINVLLVKSTNADNVSAAGDSVAALFTGAKVTDASETADQVTGSLVNASNLTNKFIGITSVVVVAAALIIVSLLTVLSVNKRVRELGTLKAIGWSNGMIVRQIVTENIVVGIIGAAAGIGLGLLGLYLVNHFDIQLSATFQKTASEGFGFMRRFGGDSEAAAGTTTAVPLHVNPSAMVLGLGAGVAILGAIVASLFASLKASRMKPQEALRNIE